jgi:hypothetical protein
VQTVGEREEQRDPDRENEAGHVSA